MRLPTTSTGGGLDRPPWVVEAATVAAQLGSDPERGLTSAEVVARLGRIGPNRLSEAPAAPAWRKLVAQFRGALVYVLLGAVGISLATWLLEGADGAPYEAIVIAAILVANAVLGFVQEARAERAVAALQRIAAPTSRVVRDGVEVEVPAAGIVPGDVLLLGEGDAISADGRLLEAVSLTVTEAALTGESQPVPKDTSPTPEPAPLAERLDMVYSGTAVTRGRGRAVVTATGMATEVGRIARLLGETEQPATPLQREIDRVGKGLGVAVLVVAAVVMAAIFATTDIDSASEVVDVLLVGVALAVAAVPEGLPAVLSVVLALGVQRMARERAVVKRLSSVETLGAASVICTDKTGTLTRNEMSIRRVVTRSGAVDVTGTGYRPEGELLVDGLPLDEGPLLDEVRVVLSGGSLAGNASLREEGGEWVVTGDPTDAAFLVAERKAGFAGERSRRFQRLGEVPFTSERRLMSTVEADAASEGRVAVMTKGAPDVVLARCSLERTGTSTQPLDDGRRSEILAAVDALADDALRTLAVAYRPLPDGAPAVVDERLEHELVFAGVVGIIDPPRPEACDAVAEARHAGIRVVMITGDHPRTAARIAAEVGIGDGDSRVVSGRDVDELDDAAFRTVVREASVYARVVPEHKLRIVDALQADGNIVAMTGDGVNDAPALKSADIGVAMSLTGTDVAKEAAGMVLADDNFATIVGAVREGRSIFSNIRKFLRYLLSSNAGEVLTMLLGVVAGNAIGLGEGDGVAVPLLATQILWINLLTDTAPALAMGVDPPADDVMVRPPRRLTDRVIDREMWSGVVFVGFVMAATTLLVLDLGLPGGMVEGSRGLVGARTMAFTTLVVAQLFNCFNARSDRFSAFHRLFTNPLLWAAVALSFVLQVAVVHVPLLNDAFDTTALDPGEWLLCVALASTVLWADEIRKVVRGHRRAASPRATARSLPIPPDCVDTGAP